MAKKFLSIDVIASQKGQRQLAFFLAITVHAAAQANLSFFAGSEQHASAGVLSSKQWINQGLNQRSATEWVHLKSQLGMTKEIGSFSWGVALNRSGYLSSNRNALALAAQDERNNSVDLSPQGAFSLFATSHALKSTVMSVLWRHPFNDAVAVELSPHVLWIEDYQRSEGQLSLVTEGTQSRLRGTLSRVGTRDYGFLVDDRANKGWGWGLDVKVRWASAWGLTQLTADNILGQLRFSNVHFSNRQYDVNTTDGENLVVSDVPSLQGQYGMGKRTEKLPVAWQLNFQPAHWSGWDVGVSAMDTDMRWTLGYSRAIHEQRWWLRTVEVSNWGLGWETRMGPQWSVGLGVTATRLNNPTMTSLHVRGRW